MKKKSYLITGGTGSFGQAYVEYLISHSCSSRIIVFSRDEQKHYELMRKWSRESGIIEFCLGDIRDFDKLLKVTKQVDYVVHSAAMKHMPLAEAHMDEAIKTNIIGSQNLIKACVQNKVQKVVALSTDKSVLPINVYGATKFLLERLFVSADSDPRNEKTRFSVVRYANVFGSKGSVVPLFLQLKKTGVLPITHPDMSRFSITMQEGIDLVEFALHKSLGGEVVVPIVPSFRVGSIAKAICEECEHKIVGPRIAEKMHEDLISEYEKDQVIRKDAYYLIVPGIERRLSKQDYLDHLGAVEELNMTAYRSDMNQEWLSVPQIKALIDQLD